jgi:hypothetical protein
VDWHFFTVDLEDAALMDWDRGELTMTRWSRERGLERLERPAPLTDEPRR